MSSAQQQRITEAEQRKYWDIFTALDPINGYLNGFQAKSVLENSQLDNTQLEQIWDLADVDNDGNLDFEEFCVAMRLIFDVINGVYPSVPKTLPDFLVPSSKAHLVAANQAISSGLNLERPDYDDDDKPGLSNDFDWYISPTDNRNYERIYAANHNRHGQISFPSLSDFYSTIDVPDTDIRRAWNLVNPKQSEYINKDATMYFLHILNHRHRGVRIPRSIPASLRSTLNQADIEYDLSKTTVGNRGREDDVPVRAGRGRDDWNTTSSSRKDDFAAGYLSRLGVGEGSSKYNPSGTDFSSVKDTDWEKVRLQRELATLNEKIESAEAEARSRRLGKSNSSSKSALVKRELEQMLDFKRRELRRLKDGEDIERGGNLERIRNEVQSFKEQVDALAGHLSRREEELKRLQREIERI